MQTAEGDCRSLRRLGLQVWLPIVVCLPMLVCLGCNSNAKEDPMEQLQAGLERTTPEHVGQLQAGSAEEEAALARFADFVSRMSVERTPPMVAEVYATQVYFNDTLKEINDREALATYFRHSLGGAEEVTVEILDVARSDTDYYVRWLMSIRFRKLADNKLTRSTGVSHLRFDRDGRIVFHQDYWDSASGFFQYVPVVGRLIGWVKRRL